MIDHVKDGSAANTERPLTWTSTVLDFFLVVSRYQRFITWTVLLVTVAAVLFGFLSPKWYKSTASVLPAEKTDFFGGLSGVANIAKSITGTKALGALGGNTEMDRYLAILKSGRVISEMIDKFDLVHVYEITSYPGEKTAKELMSNTELNLEPEGNLTISVYDKDPQRAADMANYFVELLNKVNSEMLAQNARGNRIFIEERYGKNLADIRAAEDSLRRFQQIYGVVSMPDQIKASVEAGATLLGQLAMREVQLGVLRRTTTDDNPGVQNAQAEIEELRTKVRQMNTGVDLNAGGAMLFVPFKQIPDLGVEYLRLYREVEIQYKILQYVSPLYEQAKVEEKRETPSVLVLDRAGPAERKAKPKIALYGLMGLVGSLLFCLVIVFAFELRTRMKGTSPEAYQQVATTLRDGWFGLRVRKKR
jgi:uncharacterized protein involved in exopolysaccharide biosynthesis